jgi:hypothetical protein
MDFNLIINIFFKIAAIVLALIYVIFSIVVAKQVGIMTKTLEDKFNVVVIFISSLQTTISLILLIFAIFLI